MYGHLLFDADGTLFDFAAAEKASLEALFLELGIPGSPEIKNLYSTINQELWHELEQNEISIEELKTERFYRFFSCIGANHDPRIAGTRFLDHLSTSNHMFPETIKLLTELRSRGYSLTLITNGIARVQRGRLKATKTEDFFDRIIISEEVGSQKPDNAFFQAFFSQAGMDGDSRRHALVIGDSLSSDILGGINAGLDTCWYNPEGKPVDPQILPTYEISLLFELLSLLPPLELTF